MMSDVKDRERSCLLAPSRWRNHRTVLSTGASLFVTTILVAITVGVIGWSATLPAALIFTIGSCVLVRVDLQRRRLPHRIVLPAIVAVLAAQAIAAWTQRDAGLFVRSLAGAAVAGGGLLAVHMVSPEGLGFGDVTYATLIGATLGWYGLDRVGLGIGLGFVIGAIAAGPVLMLVRRRVELGGSADPATLPFGPALAAGAWLALCWGEPIAQWYG
jgi:leader peptidase (prepilin peptidase)/N-methyltransferase